MYLESLAIRGHTSWLLLEKEDMEVVLVGFGLREQKWNPPGLPGILEESWRNPPGIQEFLGFLVNSWWIPGGFLGFRVNSWWIPGGFLVFLVFLVIPGIPGNSWWIPGGILMDSGEIS
ncbi:hypothetical protein BYT27DRAFT_7210466 [Phlegmacium glaucopus]|nr:hypothetical protein BYT27DRAFT_7210466 [Phlegmacium glaucopus]